MVAKAPRERIHVDLFGPLPTCTSTGASYGCIQIDAHTKKIVVHLLETKEAKPIATAVETSWEPPPKEVQTDWGSTTYIIHLVQSIDYLVSRKRICESAFGGSSQEVERNICTWTAISSSKQWEGRARVITCFSSLERSSSH
jgi:hypothetical protein